MPFRNRADAGRQLAHALRAFRGRNALVLALPRGGVPIAAEVVPALDAQLDLVFVRKLGVPFQPELAMGAVTNGPSPVIVRNEDVMRLAGISEGVFQETCRRELAEIARRRQAYLGCRERIPIAGRVVIVVDDGLATGATARAALRTTRAQNPDFLVLAVPVAPSDVIASLRNDADDVVCLEQHDAFGAIGFYYADFSQVTDEAVIAILARFLPGSRTGAKAN